MALPWAYFDTSVLVKRYLPEEGSRRARELIRRHRFVSCITAPLEAFSAFSRREAAGDLSAPGFNAILARLRTDRVRFELVELSDAILSRAETVIARTGVRTLDALHIASALNFHELSRVQLAFITADERQRDAAQQMGLEVIWVAPD